VIDMALLSVIRRWALRDRVSIREISRRTCLSRNTIRKYLRSGAVEPKFKVPERPSKLDRFADKLSHWLKVEAGTSRKQKRTVKQLHADLVTLGYEGSYGRVAAFVREWKADRQRAQNTTGRGVFVPLVFQPGEAFQFDWSEDWAILGGQRTRLQVAHLKLAHSRAFILRAYPIPKRPAPDNAQQRHVDHSMDPRRSQQGEVQTWVNSRWKNPTRTGQISVEINSSDGCSREPSGFASRLASPRVRSCTSTPR
jgi:hypothetical protein